MIEKIISKGNHAMISFSIKNRFFKEKRNIVSDGMDQNIPVAQ